jgi:TolA-binding protein
MNTTARVVGLFLGFFGTLSLAQQPAADPAEQQAAALEARLAKLPVTAPEAADVMVQLVNLYHQQGRTLGLVRVGEDLVSKHPGHAGARDAMLKLLDGLRGTSRTARVVAVSRQFIERFPKDADRASVEHVMAAALGQLGRAADEAQARADFWTAYPDDPRAVANLLRAVALYEAAASKENLDKAATLLADFAAKKPQDPRSAEAAWRAATVWGDRAGDAAKALKQAREVLAKFPGDAARQQAAHLLIARQYTAQQQWENALTAITAARGAKDTADVHRQLVATLVQSAAAPERLDTEIRAFAAKYPADPFRAEAQAHLAASLAKAGKLDAAVAAYKELLAANPRAGDVPRQLFNLLASDQERWTLLETTLKDALAKHPKDGELQTQVRWLIGWELFEQKAKTPARAVPYYREIVEQWPSNSNETRQAVYRLLTITAKEGGFDQAFAVVQKLYLDHVDWRGIHSAVVETANRMRNDADRQAQVARIDAFVRAGSESPAFKRYTEAAATRDAATRIAALEAGLKESTSPPNQRFFTEQLARTYRQHPDGAMRIKALPYLMGLADGAPDDAAAQRAIADAAFEIGEHTASIAYYGKYLTAGGDASDQNLWYRVIQNAVQRKNAEMLGTVATRWDAHVAKSSDNPQVQAWLAAGFAQVGNDAESVRRYRAILEKSPDSPAAYEAVAALVKKLPAAERVPLLTQLLPRTIDNHAAVRLVLAELQLREVKDLKAWEQNLTELRQFVDARPWTAHKLDDGVLTSGLAEVLADAKRPDPEKVTIAARIASIGVPRSELAARLTLMRMKAPPTDAPAALGKPASTAIEQQLALQATTARAPRDAAAWDQLMAFVQQRLEAQDHQSAATTLAAMLEVFPQMAPDRRTLAQQMLGRSYARVAGAGLAVDESQPFAPLLRAAMVLRLGDTALAWQTYEENQAMFDTHRDQLPTDLVVFVARQHMLAGGEVNFERVEDILRQWMVKNAAAPGVEDEQKATVQLLLAENFFRAERYDVARSEFTSVINQFGKTSQAIDAQFRVGESFMMQKVYDKAEQAFSELARHRQRDVAIRAEFLRGVLAGRRGDRDESRAIFRRVLDMVPTQELANQALFMLSEVYGQEERYIEQLELLRTVGRLGRASKRWHKPGDVLSIVVQDADLGISRGAGRIPVRVTTSGGDEELVFLYSGGAGKGLFRADLDTTLGDRQPNSRVLELAGEDLIKCDFPDDFKRQFRNIPSPDTDIRVAADAVLKAASSKIIDEEKETIAQRLEREARERAQSDQRRSAARTKTEVRPGNTIYVQVTDPDRDLSGQSDSITVKVTAASGDQVQTTLGETAPHSGIFTGTVATGELPAGALASDHAVDRGPLFAIDNDPTTFWQSEPDGLAPKWLAVDMKELKQVARVVVHSNTSGQSGGAAQPKADAAAAAKSESSNGPVRMTVQGSHDGKAWFPIAAVPPIEPAAELGVKYGAMQLAIFNVRASGIKKWDHVRQLVRDVSPAGVQEVTSIGLDSNPVTPDKSQSFCALYFGKFVVARTGAYRFATSGGANCVAVDDQIVLDIGTDSREGGVWIEKGLHNLTVFYLKEPASGPLSVRWAQGGNQPVALAAHDFDLTRPEAKLPVAAAKRDPARVTQQDGVTTFRFEPRESRFVRLFVDEYRGDAVAVNHLVVGGADDAVSYIPTKADLVSLATNNTLELTPGDVITVAYTDERTQRAAGESQLLTAQLTATYFNAEVTPISYTFAKDGGGAVTATPKQVIRVDPGERFVVNVVDYDMDVSPDRDKIKIQVAVNDGKPIELEAIETEPFSGVFTKEVDTAAAEPNGEPAAPDRRADPGQPAGAPKSGGQNTDGQKPPVPDKARGVPAPDALRVRRGDQIVCSYTDVLNTDPGHATPRIATVFVNQPTEGKMRIVATRMQKSADPTAKPTLVYLPEKTTNRGADVISVAFEAPFTVEVIDPDAAKDEKSEVTVPVTTSNGTTATVTCRISTEAGWVFDGPPGAALRAAMEQGRFVGQLPMVLGDKNSPGEVPLELGQQASRPGQTTVQVLNVSGPDVITAGYEDTRRPGAEAKPETLTATARLLSDGVLACLDADYAKPVAALHVGERMYLRVNDPNLDATAERDKARVRVVSRRGEEETVELVETLPHSGVFTGSVPLVAAEKATAQNSKPDQPAIETFFGDELTLIYEDELSGTGERAERTAKLPVVVGTDGVLVAFSKVFGDEQVAVETQFRMAECFFELFKNHKQLGSDAEAQADLEAGRRVLRELLEDFPNPQYAARASYLLGQFYQELKEWDQAIDSYRKLLRQYPESPLAPDAQYKLAQCLEEKGEFSQALEEYVVLATNYPTSPLIANVMIRIAEHFYGQKDYLVAAEVGKKFIEKFQTHKFAPRVGFRVGQCYYKAEKYTQAGQWFDGFVKDFPRSELAADSLFWAGESYRLANNYRDAFRRYNRCRWDYPETDAAKYARGRLTLPELLAQFEADANVEEEPQK